MNKNEVVGVEIEIDGERSIVAVTIHRYDDGDYPKRRYHPTGASRNRLSQWLDDRPPIVVRNVAQETQ